MYGFAACAVRKRTPPLSGIAECGRGRKHRFLLKCVQTHAAALKSTYPGVAQLVARLLWEQDAAGSNPVTRTISLKNRRYRRFFCISGITDAGNDRSCPYYCTPHLL